MNLGIIIDSSSGISKKEAEKRGWGFLPLYLYINNKEYKDGENLTIEDYYKIIKLEDNVRTSASSSNEILKLFQKFSKKYDAVIVYGLSKELSSQTKNLISFSKDIKNIFVVESKNVGHGIIKDCEEIEKMAKENKTIEEIYKKATQLTNSIYGIAIPLTLNWLIKGGRISKNIANMAKLAKIIPIISFKNGKLEKHGKGRIFKKTIIKQAKKIKKEFPDDEIIMYHGMNPNIKEIKKESEKIFKRKIESYLFPSIIINHIGLGVVAFLVRKNKKWQG